VPIRPATKTGARSPLTRSSSDGGKILNAFQDLADDAVGRGFAGVGGRQLSDDPPTFLRSLSGRQVQNDLAHDPALVL
jgi:hypothetical protein